MFAKNDTVVLTITDLSTKGEGIGKADGFALFVKDTVPGDVIEAVIMKVKKSYGYARLLRVLSPSPDRISPLCPVARPCGGCQLQTLAYEKQLQWKKWVVRNALERIGGFHVTENEEENDRDSIFLSAVIPADPVFRYRNKAVIPVGTDKEGRLIAGFYAGHTHTIVPCEDCLLGPVEFGPIVQEILKWMEEYKVPVYNETTGEGLVRHLFLRKSRRTEQIQICFVANGQDIPEKEILKKRLGTNPAWKISGVLLNENKAKGNAIFGENTRILWGDPVLEDTLSSEQFKIAVTYQISPTSFFQVNPSVTEKIYGKVLELAALTGKETVFDLYCGIGTISLFLAKQAKEVIGVEVVPSAVENAKRNAEKNKIRNVRFLEGKAEEIVPALFAEEKMAADLVVIDPPRKGCDHRLLETIIQMRAEKLIYVSCDPATMARDLKILSQSGYKIQTVIPFDQFALTSHVETVVLLSRESK